MAYLDTAYVGRPASAPAVRGSVTNSVANLMRGSSSRGKRLMRQGYCVAPPGLCALAQPAPGSRPGLFSAPSRLTEEFRERNQTSDSPQCWAQDAPLSQPMLIAFSESKAVARPTLPPPHLPEAVRPRIPSEAAELSTAGGWKAQPPRDCQWRSSAEVT